MRLARCLMVQGTASNVGKSVVATALCRVLADRGWAVAPFKAQNMSLNAAVTPDGREIGRAQAAQAEAARVRPRAEMNPILLKPESDGRSQVVVLGRARATTSAREYWGSRERLWPVVRDALRVLRREFEVVVIEGAGSPAELNLARHDLVNMRVATEADASVLLVGDIERGGIFAQLLGTLDLLAPPHRRRVRALLVNKFRGDAALFADGARILRRRSRLPVHVLPFVGDLQVPSEDALAYERPGSPDGPRVALIAYPHMSNHDDLEPLADAGASVARVRAAADLGDPDLVVLPGSKTTLADLEWLRERGLADRVVALARSGTPVLGICGGFQMLGTELADPLGVDGRPANVRGLGLLPVRTSFERRKRTRLVRGRLRTPSMLGPAGTPFEAYEIHAGTTRGDGVAAFAELERVAPRERVVDGAVSADGGVVGTYAHGLFANAVLREALLARLAQRRGRAFVPRGLAPDPYARVAAWLAEAIDTRALLVRCGIPDRG